VALYSSSGGQCSDLACVTWESDDGSSCSPNFYGSTIYFDSTEGTTYYIAIIGQNSEVGSFGVYVADSISGCDDSALPLPVDGSLTIGSNENGSGTAFSSCDSGDVSGQSSWYSFVGTGRRMVVSTCTADTNLDTNVALYSSSGGQCSDLACVTWESDDGSSCSPNFYGSTIYFDSTEGTTYYIAIIGQNSEVGSFGVYVADDG
jgi:hypothetical protein